MLESWHAQYVAAVALRLHIADDAELHGLSQWLTASVLPITLLSHLYAKKEAAVCRRSTRCVGNAFGSDLFPQSKVRIATTKRAAAKFSMWKDDQSD